MDVNILLLSMYDMASLEVCRALMASCRSGKSTVIGLIERFYDPLSGRVLLDGVDIRTLKLGWLRSQVSSLTGRLTL